MVVVRYRVVRTVLAGVEPSANEYSSSVEGESGVASPCMEPPSFMYTVDPLTSRQSGQMRPTEL